MNKFLQNNKKTILTIAGLGAVSAALIAFVSKKSKTKEIVTNPRPKVTSQLLKLSLSLSFASTDIPLQTEEALEFSAIAVEEPVFLQKEKVKVVAPFNVEYNEWKYFTVKTMEQFIDALVQAALPSYVELVKTTREERRNHQEIENYVVSSKDFSYNFDEMLDKCQVQVLRELGLAENLYDNSVTYYMGCCNKEVIKLRAAIPEKLKALLKASKALTVAEVKEILRTQVQIMEKFAENIKMFSDHIFNPNDVPRVLGDKISDLIFNKYSVEEEDLRVAVESFKEDVEVEQLVNELQAVRKRLIVS